MGSSAWDRWLGISGFGSLAWDLGLLALDLWLGIFSLGSLAWVLGLGTLDSRAWGGQLAGSWGNPPPWIHVPDLSVTV